MDITTITEGKLKIKIFSPFLADLKAIRNRKEKLSMFWGALQCGEIYISPAVWNYIKRFGVYIEIKED